MRLTKLELFYSPMCSICPEVKVVVREMVERIGADYEEINIHSSEGEIRAKEYGVNEVPCLVINGKQKISGVPSEGMLLELIEEVKDATE